MDYIKEPEKLLPVRYEADVFVAGGSCTGLFAAVRAARLGARVVLVERRCSWRAGHRAACRFSHLRQTGRSCRDSGISVFSRKQGSFRARRKTCARMPKTRRLRTVTLYMQKRHEGRILLSCRLFAR
ncbi:MAG: FAD-dependent oxidoreductase [Eubacteriales bacterium]